MNFNRNTSQPKRRLASELEEGSDDDFSIRYDVHKRRGEWAGRELELERERTTSIQRGVATATDLEQFRNTEVGKGYQAKHVIRQPSILKQQIAPVVTTVKRNTDENIPDYRKDNIDVLDPRIAKFLNCPAFRKFRKELESMR